MVSRNGCHIEQQVKLSDEMLVNFLESCWIVQKWRLHFVPNGRIQNLIQMKTGIVCRSSSRNGLGG